MNAGVGTLVSSVLHRRKLWFLLLLILCLPLQAFCAQFSVRYAQTRLPEQIYQLDAKINYELSEAAIEALDNSIELTVVLDIEVQRERWYYFDETVITIQKRYRIKHHALTNFYSLLYLDNGVRRTFSTLDEALTQLGRLDDFPLMEKSVVQPGENYWVYLRTYLDIEALPAPMRPLAYFSSQWRLNSDWFVWPLHPLPIAPTNP